MLFHRQIRYQWNSFEKYPPFALFRHLNNGGYFSTVLREIHNPVVKMTIFSGAPPIFSFLDHKSTDFPLETTILVIFSRAEGAPEKIGVSIIMTAYQNVKSAGSLNKGGGISQKGGVFLSGIPLIRPLPRVNETFLQRTNNTR